MPRLVPLLVLALTLPGFGPAKSGIELQPAWLADLHARSIGPAVMGGRVSDIALDPVDRVTFYVGLATGGIEKTRDAGTSFQPIFDGQPVASIGAIAVAPSNARVVWVGTGEGDDRNSAAWGDGVYRSDDAGGSWRRVGLGASRAIARVVVHPKDPNTAWVAALGDLWTPGGERGLFRTTDGGKHWTNVLHAEGPGADMVGCSDVALDPSNPRVVYASLYARRRRPWTFQAGPAATGGRDLGGLFKSEDGGDHWQRLAAGLPAGTGRMGLAVAPSQPRTVYAVVQCDALGTAPFWEVRSRAGGVFRSDDGGAHWTRTSPLDPRPFYFSQIRVDPANPRRIYVLGFTVHISEDGGKTFREDRTKKVHVDNHALAIDPRDPRRLVLGNDGGVYQSWNGGESWQYLNRFAAGEFYRIALDDRTPYRVMGGLQDAQTWLGPSRNRRREGIGNGEWLDLGGGDGFYCAFDRDNDDLVYAESQEGSLFRLNLATGEARDLRPAPGEGQPAFRFAWNAPLVASRHAPDVLYLGGNRVFRLGQHGEAWTTISPDLSTRDPERTTATGSGAESYGVVYALAESPRRAGELWAGTDDGKLWRTRDAGAHWQDLTGNLPGEVRGRWVSRVEPGHASPEVAYVALDGHRDGDYAPHLLATTDGGRSFHAVTGNLPAGGPVRVVREDPANPDLLYAGTEHGLYASGDRGGHWVKFGGLPTVAVEDLVVQPRTHDLVVATHGRGLFILDDLGALAGVTGAVAKAPAHLFEPHPAAARFPLRGIGDTGGDGVFYGANPPDGAWLDYFIGKGEGEVTIKVTTADDQPVAELHGPGRPGLHRLVWDLRPARELLNDYRDEGQRVVPPGRYKLTLDHAGAHEVRMLEVLGATR